MRDDMAKVVTERPRRGHANKSLKTTGPRIRRYDSDREYDEPTRLPIARYRQYGCDAKEFSDLGRTYEYPIEGLYVHPKTGLVREQSHTLIRRRHRRHR
jgi:hypothetical protein